MVYFFAAAWLSFSDAAIQRMPWQWSFFLPMAVYLGACYLRGLRFAYVLKSGTKINHELAAPYQSAFALSNISLFYFSDLFTYWFYKPFVNHHRLLGIVALMRVADALILLGGFAWMASASGGLWALLFMGLAAWGAICLGFLWIKHRKLLKRKFLPIFGLSLLAWAMEWLALLLLLQFQRGGGSALKALLGAFLIGPNLAYWWLHQAHFVIGFACLILLSYQRNGSE